MVGVETLVSSEVEDVSRELDDLLDTDNVPGAATVFVTLAGGVALAQQIVDVVMPRLDMNPDPATRNGFLAAGVVQLIAAIVVGAIVTSVIGPGSVIWTLGILVAGGVGVMAGANLFEAGQRTVATFTEAAEHRAGGAGARERRPADAMTDGGQESTYDQNQYDPSEPTSATA